MRNANFYSKRRPEQEQEYHRHPEAGYGVEDEDCFLRCVEHGAPHPLIRWHQHKEYELHLITASSGRFFVGDYIGEFRPGNLVLIGPNLPHNWVSRDLPKEGIQSRDFSLQFADEPFRNSCRYIPELQQALPLLDRSKHGIEFYGISDFALQLLRRIKSTTGLHSFKEFLNLIIKLSKHEDYRLLSSSQLQSFTVDSSNKRFSETIEYLKKNFDSDLTMAEMADKMGMESSKFSRNFKKETGYNFTSYVNRLRINSACNLLAETNQNVSTICYRVGYNTIANFNRRFFQIKKVTPKEYRKLSQSKFN